MNSSLNNNNNLITFDEEGRPSAFKMQIHSGMLETMGHNMYSSIAKCLAEFVANAYDADAQEVKIDMDFEAINNAKAEVRKLAKQEKADKKRKDISAIYDPLPATITITITDDGHGMNAKEIQSRFMAITRNRREDERGKPTNIFTESGKRRVMGRKGVGKLAGFGAAEHIKIRSKRSTQNYSTTFEMDYSNFKGDKDLTEPTFKATYNAENNQAQYTVITLSQLRCDSMKSSAPSINNTLARTFSILDKNFKITINGAEVKEQEMEWEYTYPEKHNIENMAVSTVIIDDEDEDSLFDIKYLIRFRARPDDADTTPEKRYIRGSLPADRRGARIYSHGRLAHGPSLLGLHSGVHNFHAQDYMECVVIADAIDEFEHDCIVTSREGLHQDNPVVSALFNEVTNLMKEALKGHYKQRDHKITREVEEDDFSKGILSPLQNLNSKSRRAAKEILKVIGKEHGVKSSTYQEMAPILLQAVNAGDAITNLIKLETDPKSIQVLTHAIAELSRMENNDLLKLYRGRTKAINALSKLHSDSLDTRKGEGYENELHLLLKESPWLIRPEFANYLTSEKTMGNLCKTLNTELKIDDAIDHSKIEKTGEDNKRPDLVFLACNSPEPDDVIIVELKSPGIEMSHTHLTQLRNYMRKTNEYLVSKFGRNVRVKGFLIGTKPKPDSKSDDKQMLLQEVRDEKPNSEFRIIDIIELISHAKQIHQNGIEIFEAEEKRLESELS